MFEKKKEDKNALPDLPPLKNSAFGGLGDEHDELDDEFSRGHDLPSFPDKLSDKGFSQAAIKDAVSQGETKHHPGNYKSMEMEEWNPDAHESDDYEGDLGLPPEPVFRERRTRVEQMPNKNKDVFVKLDKFYSARKALIDAQEKLVDIDELMKKIRETKLREEQELGGWEKEISSIKARLNDVTLHLFEKVD